MAAVRHIRIIMVPTKLSGSLSICSLQTIKPALDPAVGSSVETDLHLLRLEAGSSPGIPDRRRSDGSAAGGTRSGAGIRRW